MKQRTSFILKGLISLVLSLVMLCGTAVTSLSAVTVDLAETGATAVTSLTSGKTYYFTVGSAKWYVEAQSNSQCYIKDESGQYISGVSNGSSVRTGGTKKTFKYSYSSGFTFTCDNTYNLYVSSNSLQGSWSNSTKFTVYEDVIVVKFNANGGSGTMEEQKVTDGTVTLAPNAFTRNSYDFTGWNTAADGSGYDYDDEDTITGLSAELTLYAQWKLNSKVTLYFTNNHFWRDVRAYLFKKDSSPVQEMSAWPGEAVKYVGTNTDSSGNDWQAIYSITIDTDLYDTVIFNGKDGDTRKQTVEINISNAASGGFGVYSWNDPWNDDENKYNVNYYPFNPESSGSGSGSGSTITNLDHDSTYLIGRENDKKYILEPYGTNEWVFKEISSGKYYYVKLDGSFLTGQGFSAENAESATKWTFEGIDYNTSWSVFGGAKFKTTNGQADVYILYTDDQSFTAQKNDTYHIALNLITKQVSTYRVTVTKKSTANNLDYVDEAAAGTVTYSYGTESGTFSGASSSVTDIENGTTVKLKASANEGYTFLGWFTDEGWVNFDDTYTLPIMGNNINLVARYTTNPVTGTYKFTYNRRNIEVTGEDTTWTKTVTRPLVGAEIDGYDGNGNTPNMPTYLYTSRAKMLFGNSPLLTASLAVQGNDDKQDNVSTYKNDIVWPDMASATLSNGITLDTTNKTVTVTATTTPMKFVFKYVIKSEGDTVHEGATLVDYAKAVTFNPIYKDDSRYQYVNDEIPAENFSYWSADADGNIPITTNRTFGMLLRGDYTNDGDKETIVTVYAQYGMTPTKVWNPLIEETKLTRTIADDDVDWVWADYMTNYLSKDGSVVQNMIDAGNNKIKYGLFVMKYPTGNTAVSTEQSAMETTAKKLIDYYHTNGKSSAYIKDTDHIGYVYEYSDKDHISDFNRTLYTIKCSSAKAAGMTFSAVAYITVDGENYFYSAVNSDIVIKNLVD